MERILTASQHLIFVNLTSFIAILGGLALWGGFVLLGLISRQYEKVYQRVTHWQFLVVAPGGLFIYLLMQSFASLRHENMGSIEQWTGYTLLIWSALLTLWASFRFYQLFKALTKEQA